MFFKKSHSFPLPCIVHKMSIIAIFTCMVTTPLAQLIQCTIWMYRTPYCGAERDEWIEFRRRINNLMTRQNIKNILFIYSLKTYIQCNSNLKSSRNQYKERRLNCRLWPPQSCCLCPMTLLGIFWVSDDVLKRIPKRNSANSNLIYIDH